MTRPALALLALALAAAPAGAQDPGALLRQAREALAAGRLDEALERVERALRARDDLPEPYLLRGHIRAAQGRLAEAVEDATEAIDLDPSRPDGYHLRGELFTAQGKLQAAIRDHEVALSRDRRFLPARLGLGRAQERALEYEDAQRHFEAALAAGTGPEVAHEAHAALGALLALRADPLECALDAPDAGAARALGAERLAAAADHAERAVAARARAWPTPAARAWRSRAGSLLRSRRATSPLPGRSCARLPAAAPRRGRSARGPEVNHDSLPAASRRRCGRALTTRSRRRGLRRRPGPSAGQTRRRQPRARAPWPPRIRSTRRGCDTSTWPGARASASTRAPRSGPSPGRWPTTRSPP
ncbi:MAG: tetratricopeptide repeat protein [Planctomycetes bacterium]|nr:tetratricopeptide repeat protein [Planctomycetota bacterium]